MLCEAVGKLFGRASEVEFCTGESDIIFKKFSSATAEAPIDFKGLQCC